MDLSVIDQLSGHGERGLAWQAKALEKRRAFSTNRRKVAQPKLLVFADAGPMGDNTPIEFLLQNSDFEIITYYPNFQVKDPYPLPPHDIAFCAASLDSSNADVFFENLRNLTETTGTKTVNFPDTPVALERDKLPVAFSNIGGLRFPQTCRVPRLQLEETLDVSTDIDSIDTIGGYPCLIRPCGSHAGRGLKKLNTRDCLKSYLLEREESEFFISEFINYASPQDGNFRKYRIIFIDGHAFPCHMAISDQWDLWYLNANMHASESKRKNEADFMDTFDLHFAKRHHHAFDALSTKIGLDYFGIDCAEDAEGNLIIFEADNALIVHDMDCEILFPYKKRHMQNIFEAFENMLLGHCPRPVRQPQLSTDGGLNVRLHRSHA
ncbi:ATP-grasp domain-containing protein [Cochlodiniinecator piscidefendens]|uniref:ATP-grasp domain-containing protein n=1 Tax=Cochlodiniinecator piscidefendens TaxID=2715756 RepID=UPI00140B3B93|nr:hypothetical protein [Cochlodiniinecator piscidefendens]